VYATARDFARFGLFYLRDGIWDGARILPEGWVDFARTLAEGSDANVYGAGFWLTPPEGQARPPFLEFAGLTDSFQARGFEGQIISIVPSKDLVLVRLGHMREENWDALSRWVANVESLFPNL
jgi:CubicO group peptidase (beta-lactamase class C family)